MDTVARKIGNIIECENGYLSGGHTPICFAHDKDGKKIKKFRGGKSHMQSFVDSCHSNSIEYSHGAENGHLSAALAHIGNISWKLGAPTKPGEITAAINDPVTSDAVERMLVHLEENGVDPAKDLLSLGKNLSLDPEKETFTGDFADEANALLKGSYRKGFEIIT